MAIEDKIFCAQRIVEKELLHAITRYPAHNSAHEAYAVLLEEMDELWDEVKKSSKRRDEEALLEEATQVAAMALRFIVDVCMKDKEG